MAVNYFDQAARYAIKLDPAGFFAWLLGEPTPVFREWLDTRTLPFPGEHDRTCDTVARLDDPANPNQPLALVVEAQSEPDPDILERVLEYLARLRRELRHGPGRSGKYGVGGAVLNLTGPPQADTLHTVVPGQAGGELLFRVTPPSLRDKDATATLQAIAAGQVARCILPWVPLMQGGGESGIMEEWKRCASAEPDNRRRADYAGLALVLSELSGVRAEWQRALEGWNMKQSQQVLEWQAEARAESRLETLRGTLLRLLQLRCKTEVPADLQATVANTTDAAELSRWIDAAATVDSFDAFRAAIKP